MIQGCLLALSVGVTSTKAEVTDLNLARSKYTFAQKIGLVLETRLEQKNRQRFMTVSCFTEGDFLVKKFDTPLLKISNVPVAKVTEVRGTLSRIMIVLDDYINSAEAKVEFTVGFNLYGGAIKLNQKGLVHPRINDIRLQSAQRALINVDNIQTRLQTTRDPEEVEALQKQLRRAQRELELCKKELTGPVRDTEILYDHGEALQFFQSTINAIDRLPELTKLLDESVINRFNQIPGAVVPAPIPHGN